PHHHRQPPFPYTTPFRSQVRAEIKDLQRRTATTMIYVTHDQVEAMTLGDRVAVLDQGRLQQIAPPGEVYDRPANAFVGGFIGNRSEEHTSELQSPDHLVC